MSLNKGGFVHSIDLLSNQILEFMQKLIQDF